MIKNIETIDNIHKFMLEKACLLFFVFCYLFWCVMKVVMLVMSCLLGICMIEVAQATKQPPAVMRYLQQLVNRDYLHAEMLVKEITVTDVLSAFSLAGVSSERLEKILTLPISVKLLRGQIVTEQDLNNMRGKINEENLKALVVEMVQTSNRSAGEILNDIWLTYYMLPMIVLRDGFLKKVVHGMRSNQDLLKVLEKVEQDSIYYPTAVELLHEASNLSKKKRKNFLNSIRDVIRKNKELSDNMSSVGEVLFNIGLSLSELPEGYIDQGEQPVKLLNPAVLRQQKKTIT